MIEISLSYAIPLFIFFIGTCISLIIYIYNNLVARVRSMEKKQIDCPINKIYTLIEKTQVDICWIKKTIQKKA